MNDAERLKQCYRIANEFIESEHEVLVNWSHECSATLSVSAAILACKLFDLGEVHPGDDKSLRADLLDLTDIEQPDSSA